MPWSPGDAKGKTSKATTPKKKEAWAKVANDILRRSGDDGKAIRIANAVVRGKRKT